MTTPSPVEVQTQTVIPVKEQKVKFPVPSKRLIEFIKTGPVEIQRDMANYMIEVKGLGELKGK